VADQATAAGGGGATYITHTRTYILIHSQEAGLHVEDVEGLVPVKPSQYTGPYDYWWQSNTLRSLRLDSVQSVMQRNQSQPRLSEHFHAGMMGRKSHVEAEQAATDFGDQGLEAEVEEVEDDEEVVELVKPNSVNSGPRLVPLLRRLQKFRRVTFQPQVNLENVVVLRTRDQYSCWGWDTYYLLVLTVAN
jgi:hypothetical protein